jgi:hypothetical protein
VNAAAFARPLSYMPTVAYYLAIALLVPLIVIAAGPTVERSVYARGMLLAILLITPVEFWKPDEEIMLLGGGAAVDQRFTDDDLQSENSRAALMVQNKDLMLGVLGGGLALWRYRVMVRREQDEEQTT